MIPAFMRITGMILGWGGQAAETEAKALNEEKLRKEEEVLASNEKALKDLLDASPPKEAALAAWIDDDPAMRVREAKITSDTATLPAAPLRDLAEFGRN